MSQQTDNKNSEDESRAESNESSRRNFLKLGVIAAGLTVAGTGLQKVFSNEKDSGEKVKVLTTDGKLVEVDSAHIKKSGSCCGESRSDSRVGIPNRKFVMVIDLSRCKDARKCQQSCAKHHLLPDQTKYLKVLKMEGEANDDPYWMPKPCFHCDHPPCVKVCPVDATYKRTDGIVLIDNERCIGCRFCMAACPYSARSFNWAEPEMPSDQIKTGCSNESYSPETSVPRKKGTVEKCDFCPDMLRQNKLPHCVSACPNGVYYFGDINEDTVTNGDETLRFSSLMRDRGGYRFMESLGTEPSVYYLPAVNRIFPFKDREEDKDHQN